jgi:tRNA(Ile)-lysidine synthase
VAGRRRSRLDVALDRALAAPGAPARGARILVAVSGGPDSTALLAALAAAAPAHGLELVAAHVDHGLRPESAKEAEAVRALAATVGAAFAVRRVELAPGAGLEARARRARHRALAAMAAEAGARWIATAHTRDDQAETLLLRLLRGAGRRGLGGMRSDGRRLWRPFLEVSRADVRRWLAERGLGFAIDRSNADLTHTRNRVRRLVLPFLEAEFNPRLGAALAALAGRLRDEDDWLAAAAAARARTLAVGATLPCAVGREPPALARRLVRAWLEAATGRAAGAAHVERTLALAAGRTREVIGVPGPFRLVREGEAIVCRPGRAPTPAPFRLALAPGGSVTHPSGAWRLSLSSPRPGAGGERPTDATRALFDADALPPTLVVRPPAPGDRMRLLAGHTRKLQDVLVDAKVPRERRAMVPCLVADDDIVWVAGVARGARASLAPCTRRVVEAVLEPDV